MIHQVNSEQVSRHLADSVQERCDVYVSRETPCIQTEAVVHEAVTEPGSKGFKMVSCNLRYLQYSLVEYAVRRFVVLPESVYMYMYIHSH